jgi:hypothetical protein
MENREKRKAHQDLNLWPPNCETGAQTVFSPPPPLSHTHTHTHFIFNSVTQTWVTFNSQCVHIIFDNYKSGNSIEPKQDTTESRLEWEHFVSTCMEGMFSCHDQYILKMQASRKEGFRGMGEVTTTVSFSRPQVVPECFMPLCHHSIFMLLTGFKLFKQACITANCILQLDL